MEVGHTNETLAWEQWPEIFFCFLVSAKLS